MNLLGKIYMHKQQLALFVEWNTAQANETLIQKLC